jgi:diguanylate cyclase (GGDEF)-like protein
MRVPHPSAIRFDYGRGREGPIYLARDALLGFSFLYIIAIFVINIRKGLNLSQALPILIGTLFCMFMALDDMIFVHAGRHVDLIQHLLFSRFAVGITVFVLCSMISLSRRFIDEAKNTERANRELEESRKELFFLAYHDALTGLSNRKAFIEQFSDWLAVAGRSCEGRYSGLLVVECGGFKELADRLGHDLGDKLITAAAARLSALKRRSDSLYKTDTDEFALALTGLKNESDCAIVAEKITDALGEPFTIDNHTLYLTPSIGVAVFPKDGEDATTLFRNASSAMAEAINDRSRCHFYSSVLHQRAIDRINLLHELRSALDTGELELYFQPQVDCSETVVGCEALSRWRHPRLGEVSPKRFIPLAEETGLIIPLGRWVIKEALAKTMAMRAQGVLVPVSVNISAQQIRDQGLPRFIQDELSANGLTPRDIHLEITESCIMDDFDQERGLINRLREVGCDFFIDDFGTGYSSLSYLKQLPVQAIKIDRSFVIGLPNDPRDSALVQAISSLARGLGLGVVAEGVDHESQLAFLKGIDCDVIQGFIYSQALRFAEFMNYAKTSPAPRYVRASK